MNIFARRILATPRATFTVKNPDILEVPSASDRKVWHDRDDRNKMEWMNKLAQTKGSGVSMKIGNGQFRDKVDFNLKYKAQDTQFSYKLSPRKGYTLITVELY